MDLHHDLASGWERDARVLREPVATPAGRPRGDPVRVVEGALDRAAVAEREARSTEARPAVPRIGSVELLRVTDLRLRDAEEDHVVDDSRAPGTMRAEVTELSLRASGRGGNSGSRRSTPSARSACTPRAFADRGGVRLPGLASTWASGASAPGRRCGRRRAPSQTIVARSRAVSFGSPPRRSSATHRREATAACAPSARPRR